LNARTTKDRILSPAPLARLGYPCVECVHTNRLDKPFALRVGRDVTAIVPRDVRALKD
jgi:hypothetical protein